jgi:hypothetical protein
MQIGLILKANRKDREERQGMSKTFALRVLGVLGGLPL